MIGLDINKNLDRLFEIKILVLKENNHFFCCFSSQKLFLYLTTVSGKPSVS